jgi:hypothetical protein
MVVDIAIRAYEDITGRRAGSSLDQATGGRTGPFVQLLTALFGALNVEASAASRAAHRRVAPVVRDQTSPPQAQATAIGNFAV